MNTAILLEMTERSLAGTITFPEVIQTRPKMGWSIKAIMMRKKRPVIPAPGKK